MARRVTGRRVQCQADLCPQYGKVWVIRPEPYKERGRLDAELFTWPDVFCRECLNRPAFVGYQEEEVRTGTLVATHRRFTCDDKDCEKFEQVWLVPIEPEKPLVATDSQICTCGRIARFTGYETKEEPQHEGKTDQPEGSG